MTTPPEEHESPHLEWDGFVLICLCARDCCFDIETDLCICPECDHGADEPKH